MTAFLSLALSSLLAPSSAPQDSAETTSRTGDVRRDEVLAVAERYLQHRWIGHERNVLHGPDADGVQVDTPDSGHREDGFRMDGSENVGIPYQWGGFSTPEDFDRALASGLAAGHLPSGRGAAASRHAAGVDCSGFVSRCWSLAAKRSTRSLPELCVELEDWSALQPGDVLNTFNGHVVLFEAFADEEATTATIVEAAFPGVRRRDIPLQSLREAGYHALRYGPLDPEWSRRGVSFLPADSARGPDGELVLPTPPEAPADASDDPFAGATVGTWVEYSLHEAGGAAVADRRLRVGLAALDEEEARLHLQLHSEEGVTERHRTRERQDAASLLCGLAMGLRGRIQLDPAEFEPTPGAAQDPRLLSSTLRTRGRWSVEGQEIPFSVELEASRNVAIPVFGAVRVEARIDFGTEAEPILYTYRATLRAWRAAPEEATTTAERTSSDRMPEPSRA